MATKWTSEQVNELQDLVSRGLTVKQIAKLIDRTVASVHLKVKRTNVNTEVETIALSELATKIGIHRNNLGAYLIRENIKPHLIRGNKYYYKLSDIQEWFDNGFALSCVVHHVPLSNEIWDMIHASTRDSEHLTTRKIICDAFNVYSSHVGYWIRSMGFPSPVSRSHIGHVFIRKDVEEWAVKNNKTHGSLKINVDDLIANRFDDGE